MDRSRRTPLPSIPHRLPRNIWAFLRPHVPRLMLGLALVAINRLAGLVAPATTKFLIDDIIGKRYVQLLWPVAIALLCAAAIQAFSTLALTQVLSKSAQRIITELRCRVQEHIGRLPVSFYDANRTGTLVSRIMNDVEGLRTLIGSGLVQFVGSVLTAVFALAVLLHLSVKMTGAALTLLLAFAVISRTVFGKLKTLFRERIRVHADLVGQLTESIAGVRVIKGYRKECEQAQVFFSGAHRLLEQVFSALNIQAYMGLASAILTGMVSTLILVLGARDVLAGHMTLGAFLTYTIFLSMMIAPVLQLVDAGSQFTEAIAGLERMHEVLREMPEDSDPERSIAMGRIIGRVRFQNLMFGYVPDTLVLKGISFTAEPGTVTALVGPSGAGKSTLIGLLAAFYKPVAGLLLVDDYDLSRIRLQDYRSQLGIVLQETFLFDGTIRENVAFSRPDSTEPEIMAACRAAYVHEFAEKFERGYDTIVGERGVRLSGGQKQRVAIARALLANPRILILDEATSSLDSESEILIQEALAHLVCGRTTFVIAHRLSTIRGADQILVLEGGHVIERGDHESLLKARGRYFEFYSRQYQLEANLFTATAEGHRRSSGPFGLMGESESLAAGGAKVWPE